MTDRKLFEVRLSNLVVVHVVTTSHVRALELALRTHPIKESEAVSVIPVPNLVMDGADD